MIYKIVLLTFGVLISKVCFSINVDVSCNSIDANVAQKIAAQQRVAGILSKPELQEEDTTEVLEGRDSSE